MGRRQFGKRFVMPLDGLFCHTNTMFQKGCQYAILSHTTLCPCYEKMPVQSKPVAMYGSHTAHESFLSVVSSYIVCDNMQ